MGNQTTANFAVTAAQDDSTPRIKARHTHIDLPVLLCDDNKQAIQILRDLIARQKTLDRHPSASPISPGLALDHLGIYGKAIVDLHDMCGKDIDTTYAVLVAGETGMYSKERIHFALVNEGRGVDTGNIIAHVRQKNHGFGDNNYHGVRATKPFDPDGPQLALTAEA